MSTIAKSTTVTFAVVGSGDSADNIQVEMDDVVNNSKSTFLPSEEAYFLVFTNPSDLSVQIDTTMGSITFIGTKEVEVIDSLQYVQSNVESLSKVPIGSVTTQWIGRAGGSPSVSGTSVSVPDIINGILNCTYMALAKSYKISGVTIPVGLEEVEVLIVVSPS